MHHFGKQLARLAGRAENQALSVTNQLTARHNRLFIKIFQVGIGNQLVQIFESHLIFCQNNKVIPAQIFQAAGLGFESCQQRVDVGNFGRVQFFLHFFQQLDVNSAQNCRVLTRSVVVERANLEFFRHDIQLVPFHVRKQNFAHLNGINGSKFPFDAQPFAGTMDKRHIKARIVRDERQISRELQELRQRLGKLRRILDGFIRNARQLRDVRRNRLVRIDIGLKFFQHFAIAHLYRRNFGYFFLCRLETCGLGVKADKGFV